MDKTVFSGAMVMTHYNEAFAGNRVISSFNLYEYACSKFNETLRSVFKLGMKMTKKTGMLTPMMHFIISIGIAGVIWLGSYLITSNQLTPGGFVSFITALLMLYHPIKAIGSNFTNVQMSLLAMERVFGRLESIPEIHNGSHPKTLKGIKENIVFDHVWFEYEAGRPVLKDINLKINKGKTIAFVGNSGGGKSTLVTLLPRFYDVKQGSVKIDDVDVRELELDSLREHIAMVFQDNILFAGTIRENILLGRGNPFNVFGYFLYELVDRDLVRNGNNNLIARSDEVWFFGEIADGCVSEIEYAMELGKKIAFYKIGSSYKSIEKCAIDELIFEDEVTVDTEKLKQKIKEYPYISF